MRYFSAGENGHDYRPSKRSSRKTQFGITIARSITLIQVEFMMISIVSSCCSKSHSHV
eukprot:jgi/Bigna1/65505/fgenesh1_kg.113_\